MDSPPPSQPTLDDVQFKNFLESLRTRENNHLPPTQADIDNAYSKALGTPTTVLTGPRPADSYHPSFVKYNGKLDWARSKQDLNQTKNPNETATRSSSRVLSKGTGSKGTGGSKKYTKRRKLRRRKTIKRRKTIRRRK